MYNKPAGDAAIYIIEWIFGLCLRSWVCFFFGLPFLELVYGCGVCLCFVHTSSMMTLRYFRTDTGYHPLGNLPPFRLYRAKELGFRVDP